MLLRLWKEKLIKIEMEAIFNDKTYSASSILENKLILNVNIQKKQK